MASWRRGPCRCTRPARLTKSSIGNRPQVRPARLRAQLCACFTASRSKQAKNGEALHAFTLGLPCAQRLYPGMWTVISPVFER